MEPQTEQNMPLQTPSSKKSTTWFFLILLLIVLVAGGYYFYSQSTPSDTKTDTQDEENTDEENGSAENKTTENASEYMLIQMPDEGIKYENETYRFSFAMPKGWGIPVIKETKGAEGGKILAHINVSDANDASKYFQVQVVKYEDKQDSSVKDYPHTFIKESVAYAFYYSSSEESKGIVETFRLF